MKSAQLSLRVNAEVKAALEKIAQQEDRSVNYIVGKVLQDFVDKQLSK